MYGHYTATTTAISAFSSRNYLLFRPRIVWRTETVHLLVLRDMPKEVDISILQQPLGGNDKVKVAIRWNTVRKLARVDKRSPYRTVRRHLQPPDLLADLGNDGPVDPLPPFYFNDQGCAGRLDQQVNLAILPCGIRSLIRRSRQNQRSSESQEREQLLDVIQHKRFELKPKPGTPSEKLFNGRELEEALAYGFALRFDVMQIEPRIGVANAIAFNTEQLYTNSQKLPTLWSTI